MINIQQSSINEDVYDYVFHNCRVRKDGFKKGFYNAYMTLLGYDYSEHGKSDLEARAKLANELSKSKFIKNNFRKYDNKVKSIYNGNNK